MKIIWAILIVIALNSAYAEEEHRWVRVEYWDPQESAVFSHYGSVAVSVMESVQKSVMECPKFIKLSHCWNWDINEEDQVVGILSFADNEDTDVIYFKSSNIYRIVPLQGGPQELLKAHLAAAGFVEPVQGSDPNQKIQ